MEPARNILSVFLQELEAIEQARSSITSLQSIKNKKLVFNASSFVINSSSYYKKENAYRWLYAEALHFRALTHRIKLPSPPEYYQQLALPIYQDWIFSEKEVIYRGCIIPPPKNESLLEYLEGLSDCITTGNEKRAVWIKSLHSFLQFIRGDIELDEYGPIEIMFPWEMAIKDDYSFEKTEKGIVKVPRRYILRLVDDEISPIDIFAASDVVKNLADTVLNGRSNSQHTAAEALGFAWLSYAIGSAQIMTLTRETIVRKTLITALKTVNLSEDEKYFCPECYIAIQTLYGPIEIPISRTLHDFLLALPRREKNPSIFSKPLSSLLRMLYNKGVGPSVRVNRLGKITFRTFTSRPHEVIGRRPNLFKKPLKVR